jgi:hypothetical protein
MRLRRTGRFGNSMTHQVEKYAIRMKDRACHGLAVGVQAIVKLNRMDCALSEIMERRAPAINHSKFCRPQSQRIGDHRDGAEAHGGRSDHRVQEQSEGWEQHTRGKWDPDRVVDESEEQIFADVAHR